MSACAVSHYNVRQLFSTNWNNSLVPSPTPSFSSLVVLNSGEGLVHFLTWARRNQQMAKFSEWGCYMYILRVIQPSTRSTLGECDSRLLLARYVGYATWYLRSSCCSETQYAHVHFWSFCRLSILDVTYMRKCTRFSAFFCATESSVWAWEWGYWNNTYMGIGERYWGMSPIYYSMIAT